MDAQVILQAGKLCKYNANTMVGYINIAYNA